MCTDDGVFCLLKQNIQAQCSIYVRYSVTVKIINVAEIKNQRQVMGIVEGIEFKQ